MVSILMHTLGIYYNRILIEQYIQVAMLQWALAWDTVTPIRMTVILQIGITRGPELWTTKLLTTASPQQLQESHYLPNWCIFESKTLYLRKRWRLLGGPAPSW